MPPYPPKPLAGHVLGKGSEKLWKERKEAPRQESLFGAESGIAPLSECFYLVVWLFPLAGGPASRRFHPSIPVEIPLEGLTIGVFSCCFGAPRGTVLWGWKGPPKRACLPLFHNIGSTTSLLTQYKALSYGFARRLSYGFRYTNSILSRSGVTDAVGSHCF
jgi:hypothetical protein